MKKLGIAFYFFINTFLLLFGQDQSGSNYFHWDHFSNLPAVGEQEQPLGVAGPIAGIHNDVLMLAGGANFNSPFWENPKKWHDDIWVLQNLDSKNPQWQKVGKLNFPLAYSAVVSSPQGIISMGGGDAHSTYKQVVLWKWNKKNQQLEQEVLPDLPKPCAYGSATLMGETIYLAGGTENTNISSAMNNFWRLDLSKMGTNDFKWEVLPSWAGKPRAFNITLAQNNGFDNCIYVISGRKAGATSEALDVLKDVHEFNPKKYQLGENPWQQKSDMPAPRMAGSGVAMGQSHLFILSGADGNLYQKANELRKQHPGFPKEILGYHSITDTWYEAGIMPVNQLTTPVIKTGTDIIIPSGEIKPRIRSAKIWKIKPVRTAPIFSWTDGFAVLLYLLVLVGIGIYFSFHNQNTDDFFRGGQSVPWWAVGCSIFATMLSSITFMAIPAKAYATNWQYFLLNMTIIAVAPFIIYFILPFFRKINATSAYEYLELRFNLATRLFASASYILFQIGRMGIVMYLPGLALAAVSPISIEWCILIMGGMSILYSALGGIEAVIWSDTLQTIVLLGGAFFSFILIINQPEIGLSEFYNIASTDHKLQLVNWDWSYTSTGLWVIILGGIGQSLVPYTSDQGVVQRYMSVANEEEAAKSIWTNAGLSLIASLLFFGLGTALYVFYKKNPIALDPNFQTDAIFPLFISRQLPVGVAGLVIAGIFAAAQSTISTSMNSISTAVTTDFFKRFNLLTSDKNYLKLARLLTVIFGLLGTASALLIAFSDIKSLWDSFMSLLGLFGGAMCGLFFLGIFSRRANGKGALVGAFAGALVLCLVQQYSALSFLLYAIVGILATMIIGRLASTLFVDNNKPIEGLTIYSLKKNR